MMPVIAGRVAFVFDEPNFDVDRILGFEAMRGHDLASMRKAAMVTFDPTFQSRVGAGDVLIGGTNFGYGHPHGPPMAVMRDLGIAAVIADSFAPLYLMGELAAGFPQLTCPGISKRACRGDAITVEWDRSVVVDVTGSFELPFDALPAHARKLLTTGGLMALLRSPA